MANMEKAKNIPLRILKKDFNNVNKSKKERKNGERTIKRNTPRRNLEALNAIESIKPDQEPKTVQPTIESIQNPQKCPFLLHPNPNTSKSSPN